MYDLQPITIKGPRVKELDVSYKLIALTFALLIDLITTTIN